jgi:ACS family hexuronate transporter-like MFS transporter
MRFSVPFLSTVGWWALGIGVVIGLLGVGEYYKRLTKSSKALLVLVELLLCALVPFVLSLDSFWPVAIMMGVVMAGHQGFSLSIFSTITDVVPRTKVGRVTAFGAFMGNMGGALIQLVTGAVLAAGLGFTPLFLFAAVSYLLALAWLHLLLPEIQRS